MHKMKNLQTPMGDCCEFAEALYQISHILKVRIQITDMEMNLSSSPYGHVIASQNRMHI